MNEFEKELASVINKHGIDALTDTPDFILAEFVTASIEALKVVNDESKRHKEAE